MPDDQAEEKRRLLRQFGATLELVKPASIVNNKHYCNEARKRAEAIEGKFFSVPGFWVL
jgi:cysteine synthase A